MTSFTEVEIRKVANGYVIVPVSRQDRFSVIGGDTYVFQTFRAMASFLRARFSSIEASSDD